MSELVGELTHEGVAVLRLDAPAQINALSLDMREALSEALHRRFADNHCEAIVLTGAGGNFSAGGDLKSVRPANEDVARAVRHRVARLHDLVRMIVGGPKPVVAAVEGNALGAGFSLALACDGIIAADTARFGAVFGKVGLVPDAGMLYTLPRRVGGARAQQLLLGAGIVDAARALSIGLVDRVVQASDLVPVACAEAHKLGQVAPLALAAIKAAGASGATSLEEAFARELQLQPLLALTADNQEGRTAFGERRPPKFRGF